MYYREFQILNRQGRMGAFLEHFYQSEGKKRLMLISRKTGFELTESMMRELTMAVAIFTLKGGLEFWKSTAPEAEMTRAEDMILLFRKAPDFVFGHYSRTGTKPVEKVGLAVIMRRYLSRVKIDELDEFLLEEDLIGVPLRQTSIDATKFVGEEFLQRKGLEVVDEKYLDDRIHSRFKHPREAKL